MVLGAAVVLACFGTAAGTLGLIGFLGEYRSEPGADWFLASLSCQAVWGLTYGGALLLTWGPLRRGLEALSLAALVGVCLFFLAFALEYTGRGRIDRRATAGLAAAPLAALALAATNPAHHLFWSGYTSTRVSGVTTVGYAFEPLAVVVGTLALGAPLLGSLLLFDTVLSYGPLYRGEAVAVGLSPLPPVAAAAAWFYGIGPIPDLSLVSLGFLPHVVLDTYAFAASDMFEFHPATRRLGERTAVDDLPSPVVVVDDRGRVVTLNPAAESVLGVEKGAALGRPLAAHLDDPIDPADPGRIAVHSGGTTRTYSVSSTPLAPGRTDPHVDDGTATGSAEGGDPGADDGPAVDPGADSQGAADPGAEDVMGADPGADDGVGTDPGADDGMGADPGADEGTDDPLGYTLVWQDVTEEIRREQRLSVLNRILRHNVRNDMSVVMGNVELLRSAVVDGDPEGEAAERLDAVEATAEELVTLGDTAREVERVLDGDPDPERLDLEPLLSAVVAEVRERHPAATVALDSPSVELLVDGPTLQAVCEELVDNAARHGGPEPTVSVAVERTPEGAVVRVTDDGPGIPEGELAAVEGGEETALEHGSGLGLWLARWGTTRLGGDLSFETGDGTTATLWIPAE